MSRRFPPPLAALLASFLVVIIGGTVVRDHPRVDSGTVHAASPAPNAPPSPQQGQSTQPKPLTITLTRGQYPRQFVLNLIAIADEGDGDVHPLEDFNQNNCPESSKETMRCSYSRPDIYVRLCSTPDPEWQLIGVDPQVHTMPYYNGDGLRAWCTPDLQKDTPRIDLTFKHLPSGQGPP